MQEEGSGVYSTCLPPRVAIELTKKNTSWCYRNGSPAKPEVNTLVKGLRGGAVGLRDPGKEIRAGSGPATWRGRNSRIEATDSPL